MAKYIIFSPIIIDLPVLYKLEINAENNMYSDFIFFVVIGIFSLFVRLWKCLGKYLQNDYQYLLQRGNTVFYKKL